MSETWLTCVNLVVAALAGRLPMLATPSTRKSMSVSRTCLARRWFRKTRIRVPPPVRGFGVDRGTPIAMSVCPRPQTTLRRLAERADQRGPRDHQGRRNDHAGTD